MEFRVHIQIAELIIQKLFQSSISPIWLRAMYHTHLSWLGLCMYTPSQSHQPEIMHTDECYIHKQNKCLMIQQGHTILVLECKTWQIWFLCWNVCLWMHCTVLIDCTVCAHFNQYSHSPSFQASVYCIHHLHRNFGLDQEFLVEVFYLFFGTGLARISPTFNSWAVLNIQVSNIHSHQIVLMHTFVTTCRGSVSVYESSHDSRQFSISPS